MQQPSHLDPVVLHPAPPSPAAVAAGAAVVDHRAASGPAANPSSAPLTNSTAGPSSSHLTSSSNHGPSSENIRDPNGRYIRKAFLAKGATKLVYRAYDEREGLEVAWNELDTASISDMRRVTQEIQLLSRLQHPNVIRFCDAWIDQERRCIVFITELMTSGTLTDFINTHAAMTSHVMAKYAYQLLTGIAYLHAQSIIHRDLKCHNVFVNGHKGEVKIGDFGLSVMSRAATSVIGTPEFMAPEIYEEHYTNRVDIWSFGMCMLQMATGKTPYAECENVGQIFKKVTAGVLPSSAERIADTEVRDIIRKCLALDPEQRPSAEELLQHRFFQQRESSDGLAQQQHATAAGGGEENPRLRSVGSQCEEWSPPRSVSSTTPREVSVATAPATEDGIVNWVLQGPVLLQVPAARLAASMGLLSQLALTAVESRHSSRAPSETSGSAAFSSQHPPSHLNPVALTDHNVVGGAAAPHATVALPPSLQPSTTGSPVAKPPLSPKAAAMGEVGTPSAAGGKYGAAAATGPPGLLTGGDGNDSNTLFGSVITSGGVTPRNGSGEQQLSQHQHASMIGNAPALGTSQLPPLDDLLALPVTAAPSGQAAGLSGSISTAPNVAAASNAHQGGQSVGSSHPGNGSAAPPPIPQPITTHYRSSTPGGDGAQGVFSTPQNSGSAAAPAPPMTQNYSEEKKRRAQESEARLLEQLDKFSAGSSNHHMSGLLGGGATPKPTSSMSHAQMTAALHAASIEANAAASTPGHLFHPAADTAVNIVAPPSVATGNSAVKPMPQFAPVAPLVGPDNAAIGVSAAAAGKSSAGPTQAAASSSVVSNDASADILPFIPAPAPTTGIATAHH